MEKQNITLIGMAGVGKSTVGAILAQKLGWKFVDIDRLLEQERGRPLQEILDEVGEERFITLESAMVKEKAQSTKQVIAPGGSIVYSDEAMQSLKNASTIVYLQSEPEFIEKRIDIKSRGIVGLGNKDFRTLYFERANLYKKYADMSVEVAEKSPEQIAEKIFSLLKI